MQTTGTNAQGCQHDVHADSCITKEIKVHVGNVNFCVWVSISRFPVYNSALPLHKQYVTKLVACNIPSDATYSLAVGHSTSLTCYACGVFDGQRCH